MSATRCAPFWVESPSILWEDAMDFYPFHEGAKHCSSTALNSLTRFGIYLGVLLALIYRNAAYIFIAVALGFIAIALYYGMKQKGILREGFSTQIVSPTIVSPSDSPSMIGGSDVSNKTLIDVIGRNDATTLPTASNPFMNMLLDEMKSNPNKPDASNIEELSRPLSEEFQNRLYGDATDVFQHNQNQRTWAAAPSSTIPNDRESFQNWLYRVPGRTCKEGNNEVCRTNTESGNVPWLSAM